MSDSQAYEEIRVSSDGVTVTKRFEEDEFPVPAIAFEFESDRDESVTVRLSDTVPEGIEVEDLGFHPEYGSEHWTIDEDTITFERELDANSSYTTVYGIRATGSDEVQQFLTEPVIEEVEPPLPEDEQDDEDIVPDSADDVVKDAISGEGEIPGLEDEDRDGAEDEDVGTLDLKDPNQEGQAAATGGGAETDEAEADDTEDAETADNTETADVSVNGDSLFSALANEIRSQDASADDVKLLRRAFEVAGKEEDGSLEARMQQIQTDISDLRAYTGALEEFLAENGTGDEMIEDFESQLDSFSTQLDGLESELEENSSQLSSMSQEVDSVGQEVSEVSEEVNTVRGEISSVSDDVDDMSGEVGELSGELDDMETSLGDIESSLEELEQQVTEGEVTERLDDLEQAVEDLREWQDQIKSTFG